MRDLFIEIWSSVRRNKLRTALTGFAVAWGIFMLIVLLGAGNGLINGMTSNNANYLVNSISLFAGRTSMPYDGLEAGRRIKFGNADVDFTKSQRFEDVIDEVSPSFSTYSQTLTYGTQYKTSRLYGVYPSYQQIENVEILSGRFINENDIIQRRKVIVMGKNTADELLEEKGEASSLIGKYLKFGELMFQVVGIYRSDESYMGSDLYGPFSTVQVLMGRGDEVDNILFTFHGLKSLEDNEKFEKQFRGEFNKTHRANPDDTGTMWIWNRYTTNIQMNKAMSIIRIALWIIGVLTLLSGIVGVSNIMLITVKERTHEFGIRKAIGAGPFSVLKLIITESVAITGFFGYIGMALGLAACEVLNVVLGQTKVDTGLGMNMQVFSDPSVSVGVAVGAMILLIVAGTIAGIAPAAKAAKIRPIEALREE